MQGRTAPLALAAALLALALSLIAAPAAPAAGRLIAPPSACQGQSDAGAAPKRQLRAMHCMTNFARARRGRAPLRRSRALDRAAGRKSADILRCDDFRHEACGREFTFWIERFGFLRRCRSVGENLAWGTGRLGTVRSLFVTWMRSPGHRANILSRDYTHLGVGMRVGELDGSRGARVWTQAFGGGCSA